jgi:hypothetical protein
MSDSIKSINITIRLDFKGRDTSNLSIIEAVNNMEYNFYYDDYYLRLVGYEIVDSSINIK